MKNLTTELIQLQETFNEMIRLIQNNNQHKQHLFYRMQNYSNDLQINTTNAFNQSTILALYSLHRDLAQLVEIERNNNLLTSIRD